MGINSVRDTYKGFAEQRRELADLLGASSDVISYLNMSQFQENLDQLQEKVGNDTFKIMVVGTFKNGKSTFINSILGEDILPAYSIPTTAVINEVKYGEEKKAVLHFRNPLPQELPKELAERAQEHIRNHGGQAVPSLEIPYDEIEDYVVIPMGKDASEMLLESPYEKVELFWPLELLKNGVEIIDSPGLNEHATRTKVTMEYLSNADAILMVLNAQALCSESEMQFIENDLLGQGYVDPFFIVNRFDCIPRREQDMVKRFATIKLKECTSFGQSGIHYVSSLDALEGKLENDMARYEGSGMAEFEKALSDFLTKNKGRVKLAQPARELKRILNDEALYKVIPTQRKLLSTSLDEVKARYNAVNPQLKDMKVRKEQLNVQLELRIERSRSETRRIVNRYMLDTIDNVPVWIQQFEPKTELGAFPKKAQIQQMIAEIHSHVISKITAGQKSWQDKVLLPYLEEKAASIFESAEHDAGKILEQIDQINVMLSDGNCQPSKAPTMQRIVGTVGGFLSGGVFAVTAGSQGFSKHFAISVGTGLLSATVGSFALSGLINPLFLVAAVIANVMVQIAQGKKAVTASAKKGIQEKMVQELADNADKFIAEMESNIIDQFKDCAKQIVSALDIEINQVYTQLNSVIREMEKGKDNIAAREKVLNNCETKIKALNKRLDDLIFQLVGG